MGKCVKNIALSVMAAIFGAIALTGPVFATPTPDTTTPETTETTTVEQPAETPAETETTTVSCYDQVGSLGWIICPGAGLFGNVIDGAYDLLTQIIEVNPIPTDNNSPTHVVWSYFKDITNSLFIVFLLVIILSQLTGFGINNYGIKKALPRIVIAAILVNLSYIICTVAVDLSNILGNAFQAFFVNVQNIAIENGTISNAASGASVAGIVAAMIGVGASATFAAGVAFGGAGGVIWMLLPVLLSGLLAVISAVITMAARQALIFLLVMISPLALIAYTLPNTEKWYKKWLNMLAQMLFFYPMFSILYGASQLAGLVIITSATNWLGVVLGIAVKILPLFMSIPLMRMSGSVLGKISGVVNRMAAPAQGAVDRYSMSKQALAKQKQLNKRNPVLPSTRLAQYLERQRTKRDFDTKELAASNLDRNLTSAQQAWYNRDGTLSRRGLHHYQNEQAKLDYANIRTNIASDFDEGFQGDGTDKRVRARDLAAINATNTRYDQAIVDSAAAESRKRVVAHNNMAHRAELIHDHVEKEGDAIHQRVLDAFNIDVARYDDLKARDKAFNDADAKVRQNRAEHKADYTGMTSAEIAAHRNGLNSDEKKYFKAGKQAVNYTLADAISSRRKLDKEASSIYYELYDDTPAGPIPGQALAAALESGDYSSMTAAIQVMAKRGDHKDIMEILQKNSKFLSENINDPKAIRFQKEINDVCLSLKPDNQILWAWAKANMIRRGKYNGKKAKGLSDEEIPLAAFIDFDSFVNGSIAKDDRILDENGEVREDAKKDFAMVNMNDVLTNVRDGKVFAGADRTMYNYFREAAANDRIKKDANGKIDKKDYYFTHIKHLRASACSGMMDGEQLASFNSFFTMGFTNDHMDDQEQWKKDNKLFLDNKETVKEMLESYFRDMTAGQLACVKTATLETFNDAMLAINDDGQNVNGHIVSKTILDLLKNQKEQLSRPNMINQRSNMNQKVREMLGISLTK